MNQINHQELFNAMKLLSITKAFSAAAQKVVHVMTKPDIKEAAIQAVSEREKGINLTLCVLVYMSLL